MSTPSHDTLTPTGRAAQWPRAYLLGIYEAALRLGSIYVEPIRQADALSLKQSLYRLRRRSDTSNKSFITPDMHLVTVGAWEPGPAGEGRMCIMFSNAGEQALPGLFAEDGSAVEDALASAARHVAEPVVDLEAGPLPTLPLTSTDLALGEGAIDDYVARMMADAQKKDN